jgi:hypothetical protein
MFDGHSTLYEEECSQCRNDDLVPRGFTGPNEAPAKADRNIEILARSLNTALGEAWLIPSAVNMVFFRTAAAQKRNVL